MSYISLRCRHTNVKWINSHSCRCKTCNKVGHWFENEGLVMWIRDDKISSDTSGTHTTEGSGAAHLGIHAAVANSNEPAVA